MTMSLRLGGGRVMPQVEARRFFLALARAVNQRVDGRGAGAALLAHDGGGLAGKGGEQHLAVDAFGDVFGERGFAGARIAEQPEDRGRVAAARSVLEPGCDGFERGVLLGGEGGHFRSAAAGFASTGK